MLDGLLLPAALGTSRNRVLAVMAYEVCSGLGHVHEDSGEQIAGVEGLEHLGTCMLGACRPLDAVCRGLGVVVEVETLEAERRPHEVASAHRCQALGP